MSNTFIENFFVNSYQIKPNVLTNLSINKPESCSLFSTFSDENEYVPLMNLAFERFGIPSYTRDYIYIKKFQDIRTNKINIKGFVSEQLRRLYCHVSVYNFTKVQSNRLLDEFKIQLNNLLDTNNIYTLTSSINIYPTYLTVLSKFFDARSRGYLGELTTKSGVSFLVTYGFIARINKTPNGEIIGIVPLITLCSHKDHIKYIKKCSLLEEKPVASSLTILLHEDLFSNKEYQTWKNHWLKRILPAIEAFGITDLIVTDKTENLLMNVISKPNTIKTLGDRKAWLSEVSNEFKEFGSNIEKLKERNIELVI